MLRLREIVTQCVKGMKGVLTLSSVPFSPFAIPYWDSPFCFSPRFPPFAPCLLPILPPGGAHWPSGIGIVYQMERCPAFVNRIRSTTDVVCCPLIPYTTELNFHRFSPRHKTTTTIYASFSSSVFFPLPKVAILTRS